METRSFGNRLSRQDTEEQALTQDQAASAGFEHGRKRRMFSYFTRLQSLRPWNLICHSTNKLLAYLGKWNPCPRPIGPGDELWIMDNVAFPTTTRDRGGRNRQIWRAEFVTAVFSQNPSRVINDAVLEVAERLGLAEDKAAKNTITERIRPFLMQIEPGKLVTVRRDGERPLKLGPGGSNGISSDVKVLRNAAPGVTSSSTAVVPDETTGILKSQTFAAENEGWAVISDIDDTIKKTLTSDPLGALRTTFVDDPEPIRGMPELYIFLQQQITTSSPFFYLSASPYNLYPLLREFRDAHYPKQGQIILREASWMSLPDLLASLTVEAKDYKVEQMKKIYKRFPGRRVICIGDSTQADPEAYGEMYRKTYGTGWIKLILIRKVTGVATVGIDNKNKPERFGKAFQGIPERVWRVFEEPSECEALIRDAVQLG